jgi:hypothetical protein
LTQKSELTTSHSFARMGNKGLLVVMSILVAVFMVDSQIAIVADFIADTIATPEGIAAFIVIAIVFAVGGTLVLMYVRQKNKQSKLKSLGLNVSHIGVTVAHYALIAIIGIIIVQILTISQYNLLGLYAVLSISYGLWIAMLGLLAKAFFSWYKSSSKNAMILILALSMIAYVVNGAAGLATYLAWLQVQPEVVASDRVAYFPAFDPETSISQIGLVWQLSSAVAYVLTWIGTVMLLRPYIHKIGKTKFYAIMGAAMVYYLISYPLFVLGYLTPTGESDLDVLNNILIINIGSIFSGIIFGAAFLAVARTLQKGSLLREYMIIAAYGFMLFYVAGSTMAMQAAYPPFGLPALAFTGLSCYLIYAGLYSSATTVSQDIVLRQSIRKSVMDQRSQLLDSIGTAQMEKELQGRVLMVAKKATETIEEETGVASSMTEDDMKDYMELVMNEVQKKETAG